MNFLFLVDGRPLGHSWFHRSASWFGNLLFVAFFVCTPSWAQEGSERAAQEGGLRVAIVDIAIVEQRAVAFLDFRKKIEIRRAAAQSEIQKEQSVLEEIRDEIETQRLTLSESALSEKEEAFRARFQSLQQVAQRKKNELETFYVTGLEPLRTRLSAVILALAQERKVDLVFNVARDFETLLFFRDELSITEEVIVRLDQMAVEAGGEE